MTGTIDQMFAGPQRPDVKGAFQARVDLLTCRPTAGPPFEKSTNHPDCFHNAAAGVYSRRHQS
jgi:hypothetical protein